MEQLITPPLFIRPLFILPLHQCLLLLLLLLILGVLRAHVALLYAPHHTLMMACLNVSLSFSSSLSFLCFYIDEEYGGLYILVILPSLCPSFETIRSRSKSLWEWGILSGARVQNSFRMSRQLFENPNWLLQLLIEKKSTTFRQPLPSKIRLAIFLLH